MAAVNSALQSQEYIYIDRLKKIQKSFKNIFKIVPNPDFWMVVYVDLFYVIGWYLLYSCFSII